MMSGSNLRRLRIICCLCFTTLLATRIFNFFKTKSNILVRPYEGLNWRDTPDFVFYVRLTNDIRFANEYRRVLVRSMKLFVPNDAANLVVALDSEKRQDHEFGEQLKNEWPFPTICYMDPGDPRVYYGSGKVRMYWDMMYADKCTNAKYVGFVDTDTLFDTLVTPQLLFEGQKPVIIAKIGEEPKWYNKCWVKSTARFLRKKQVMNCMTAFPVMFKIQHIKEMRESLSKQFSKSFDEIFYESCIEKDDCLSQFSMICNYLWYYHRSEYSWHLQVVPRGYWDGTDIVEGQVGPDYYHAEIKPNMTIPVPRSSMHLRYSFVNGIPYSLRYPPDDAVHDIIQEGLCYSAGFDYCPGKCKKWKRNNVQFYLFSFEYNHWDWDMRCIASQNKHYNNVKEIVNYHFANGLEIFGANSIPEFCDIVENWRF